MADTNEIIKIDTLKFNGKLEDFAEHTKKIEEGLIRLDVKGNKQELINDVKENQFKPLVKNELGKLHPELSEELLRGWAYCFAFGLSDFSTKDGKKYYVNGLNLITEDKTKYEKEVVEKPRIFNDLKKLNPKTNENLLRGWAYALVNGLNSFKNSSDGKVYYIKGKDFIASDKEEFELRTSEISIKEPPFTGNITEIPAFFKKLKQEKGNEYIDEIDPEFKEAVVKYLQKTYSHIQFEQPMLWAWAWAYVRGMKHFSYVSEKNTTEFNKIETDLVKKKEEISTAKEEDQVKLKTEYDELERKKRGLQVIFYIDGLDFITADPGKFVVKGDKESRAEFEGFEKELDEHVEKIEGKFQELMNAVENRGWREQDWWGEENENAIRNKYLEVARLIEGLDIKTQNKPQFKKYINNNKKLSEIKRKFYDMSTGLSEEYKQIPTLIKTGINSGDHEALKSISDSYLYKEGEIKINTEQEIIGIIDDLNIEQSFAYIIQKQQEIGMLPIIDNQKDSIRSYLKMLYDSQYDKILSSNITQEEKNNQIYFLMALMTGRIEEVKNNTTRTSVINTAKKDSFKIHEYMESWFIQDEFEMPDDAYNYGNSLLLNKNNDVWGQLLSEAQFNRVDESIDNGSYNKIPYLHDTYYNLQLTEGAEPVGALLEGTKNKTYNELTLEQKILYSTLQEMDKSLLSRNIVDQENGKPDFTKIQSDKITERWMQANSDASKKYTGFLKTKLRIEGGDAYNMLFSQSVAKDYKINRPNGTDKVFNLMMNLSGSGITFSDNTAKTAAMVGDMAVQIGVSIMVGLATGGIGAAGTRAANATRIGLIAKRLKNINSATKFVKYISNTSKLTRAAIGAGLASTAVTLVQDNGASFSNGIGARRGHENRGSAIADYTSQFATDGISGALGGYTAAKFSRVIISGTKLAKGAKAATRVIYYWNKVTPIICNASIAGIDLGFGVGAESIRQRLLGNNESAWGTIKGAFGSPAPWLGLVFALAGMKKVSAQERDMVTRKCDRIREELKKAKEDGLDPNTEITVETELGTETFTIQQIADSMPKKGDKRPTSMSRKDYDKQVALAKSTETQVDKNARLGNDDRIKEVEKFLRETKGEGSDTPLLDGDLIPEQKKRILKVHELDEDSLNEITALRMKLIEGLDPEEFEKKVLEIINRPQNGKKPEVWKHDTDQLRSKQAALEAAGGKGGFTTEQARGLIGEGYTGFVDNSGSREVIVYDDNTGRREFEIESELVSISTSSSMTSTEVTNLINARRRIKGGELGNDEVRNLQELLNIIDIERRSMNNPSHRLADYTKIKILINAINEKTKAKPPLKRLEDKLTTIGLRTKLDSAPKPKIEVDGTLYSFRDVLTGAVKIDKFVAGIKSYDQATILHTRAYFIYHFVQTDPDMKSDYGKLVSQMEGVITAIETKRHGAGEGLRGGEDPSQLEGGSGLSQKGVGENIGVKIRGVKIGVNPRKVGNVFLREQLVYENGIQPVLAILIRSGNPQAVEFAGKMGHMSNFLLRRRRNLLEADVADLEGKYKRFLDPKEMQQGVDPTKNTKLETILQGLPFIGGMFGRYLPIIGTLTTLLVKLPAQIRKFRNGKLTPEAILNDTIANFVGLLSAGSVVSSSLSALSLAGIIGGTFGGAAAYYTTSGLTRVLCNLLPLNAKEKVKIQIAIKSLMFVLLCYLLNGYKIATETGEWVGEKAEGVAEWVVKEKQESEKNAAIERKKESVEKALSTETYDGKSYYDHYLTLKEITSEDEDKDKIYISDMHAVESYCEASDKLEGEKATAKIKQAKDLIEKNYKLELIRTAFKPDKIAYYKSRSLKIESILKNSDLSTIKNKNEVLKIIAVKTYQDSSQPFVGRSEDSIDEKIRRIAKIPEVRSLILEEAKKTLLDSKKHHPDLSYKQIAEKYYSRTLKREGLWNGDDLIVAAEREESTDTEIVAASTKEPETKKTKTVNLDKPKGGEKGKSSEASGGPTTALKKELIRDYNESGGVEQEIDGWIYDGENFTKSK